MLTIVMLSSVNFIRAEQALPSIAKCFLAAGDAYATFLMGFLTYQAITELAQANTEVAQAKRQLNANNSQTFTKLHYLKNLRRSGRFTVVGGLAATLFFGYSFFDVLKSH